MHTAYLKKVKRLLMLFLVCSLVCTLLPVCASAGPEGPEQQVIVRFDNYSDVCFDPVEQNTAILSYSCELPYVLIDSNPGAAEAVNSVLSQMNDRYRAASEGVSTELDMETYMLSQAEDYYSMVRASRQNGGSDLPGDSFLFSFSHKAYVTRCDDALIVFVFYDYTGTPMGSDSKTETLAFNAATGALLDLNTVNIADPSVYPEPERNAEGSFRIVSAAQLAEDPLSETERVIDLLEIHPAGEEYYLRVSGELYDVRFTRVVYYDRCYEKEQLWYCNRMSNEALQLKFLLPEGSPEVKLSFSSPSIEPENSSYVFAKDTEQGSLVLRTPDSK